MGEETRIAMGERGDMRPPSKRTASFAVEARWKLTCFWKSRFGFELEFHKVSTFLILCKLVSVNSVLHFANLASSKQFRTTSLSARSDLRYWRDLSGSEIYQAHAAFNCQRHD